MALIKCPECSKEVSDRAPVCPSCGLPASLDAPMQITPLILPRELYLMSGIPAVFGLAIMFFYAFIVSGAPEDSEFVNLGLLSQAEHGFIFGLGLVGIGVGTWIIGAIRAEKG